MRITREEIKDQDHTGRKRQPNSSVPTVNHGYAHAFIRGTEVGMHLLLQETEFGQSGKFLHV